MLMTHRQALEVLAKHRGDNIVVCTMSATGIWPQVSDTPLDFVLLPSAMGHAPGLGLGLALAQSKRGVIVVNGDGCMLMNLGSLVTLAQNPARLYMLIMDNGIYEVTGGQHVAGAGRTDFAQIARGAGIPRVYACATLPEWEKIAADALSGPGPVVICLKVEARFGQKTPKPIRPLTEQIRRLQGAL